MCSLCGMLGGQGHWSDSALSPEAFRARAATHTRARERQERTHLLNRVLRPLGLSVSEWAGTSYQLRSRTGQTVLVEDLAALWAAANTLRKEPCDPLSDDLLAALGGAPSS